MTPEQQKVEAYLQMIEKRGILHGRFTNVHRINAVGGGGTFSLVFTALDISTGTEVVLKFFRPDRYTPTDAYRWECFERESKLLEVLAGCRDIISLVSGQADFVESPMPGIPFEIKFAYYALEKAENGSLEDQIAAGNLSPEDLLVAFRSVTRSVQRIHSRYIAHRDLKPANFLLTSTGLKLSDFGTARLINDAAPAILTSYSYPPGDQCYASPEMMACLHDVDPKYGFLGAFFSLGAVLFEMFTGVNLGVHLFGPQLLTSLKLPMTMVSRDQRVAIFDQIIGTLVSRHPLPLIESLNPNLPPCIRQRLNVLFRDLCSLDYRGRLRSFPSIFRGIDTCLLILRNEAQYMTWQKEKQKRRAVRLIKMNGASQ